MAHQPRRRALSTMSNVHGRAIQGRGPMHGDRGPLAVVASHLANPRPIHLQVGSFGRERLESCEQCLMALRDLPLAPLASPLLWQAFCPVVRSTEANDAVATTGG
jgi:hypothetical protein